MIVPTVQLTSDQQIFWQHGFVKLNETIVTTWVMMIAMSVGSFLITRKLATGRIISRWQSALEIIVTGIEEQIKEVGLTDPQKYLAFLGTLFLFIGTCSICIVIPGFKPPTGSLSTTAALALCVFIAVPLFGIREQGVAGYLKTYIKPTFIMLPFNIISELSRTLALAIRLFGNMMSGVMIVGILLDYALRLPSRHDVAWFAYGLGAGIYLQHSCGRLHRRRHTGNEAQAGGRGPAEAESCLIAPRTGRIIYG